MSRPTPTLVAKRRHTLLRRLTVWVGLLCLSAQFASALHMLLVEHVRCAEHGELVHANGDKHEDHGSVSRDVSSSGPTIGVSSRHADHGHDHCLTCSERRKLALLPPMIPELRAPEDRFAVLAPGWDAPFPSLRIYSLAPKTSPPV
jgi:hypothetical protein